MLLQHTAIYAFGRGVPGIINFLAIAIYTRLLTPDDYGHYALVIAGVGLANSVMFEWLRLGLLRFFETTGGEPRRLLATILSGFMAGVAIASLAVAIAVACQPDPSWLGLVALSLALLFAQAWFELNLELARVQFSPVRYSLMAACRAVAGLAVGVLLIEAGFGAVGALLGVLIALAISPLSFTGSSWRGVHPRLVDPRLLKQLLAYGLPLTASLTLNFVVSASDRFLIAWLLGSEETGVYAAGYDMIWHTLTMLMMLVHLAGYPLAVRALEQQGVEACQRQLRQNFLLLVAIGVPAAAGIAVCAATIAGVILGEAFRVAAVGLIPWVALGAILARFKGYYVDLSFHLGRNTLAQVWVMLAAAGLNVVLNLWLIPLHGVQGAIYATVVSYLLAFGLAVWVGRRIFPLPAPPPEALKVLAATAVMVAVLWHTREAQGLEALLIQIALGGGSYVLGLWALDFAGLRRGLWRLLVRRRPQPGVTGG
ncbi:MAG TPA: oligosaccharide flippase family protein [Geminicoccaceae bacterium]|nr:oligosaccharide flippase family protein [Geminicoccaceae bacterium]